MTGASLAFLCEEAAKSIRRNGLMSVAALSTVAIALAVFGGSLFGLYRLHQFVAAQPEQFVIAAFLKVGVAHEKVEEVASRARGVPGVADVAVVTKDAAFAELCEQDRKRGVEIVAALDGANPLPDRLDVRVTHPNRSRAVAAILRDTKRFPEVDSVKDERELLDRLMATSRLIRNIGGGIALLLFLATGVVIQNTLRLTVLARQREIAIMRLVGATPAFIRLPLVLEGVFYGVTGALVAACTVQLVVAQTSRYVGRFETPLAQGMPAPPGPWLVLGLLMLAGLALGVVASILSIRRFLR